MRKYAEGGGCNMISGGGERAGDFLSKNLKNKQKMA